MARHRYDKLIQLERTGRLKYGIEQICPECYRPNCCHIHGWVNHKWWEGVKPSIEMVRKLGKK